MIHFRFEFTIDDWCIGLLQKKKREKKKNVFSMIFPLTFFTFAEYGKYAVHIHGYTSSKS